MAETTTRLTLEAAEAHAMALTSRLAPACERIELAGSIRRKRPDIGDIEIVAIPKRQADLFGGEGESLLDPVLKAMVSDGRLVPIKGGDKYKQFEVTASRCRLDLFLASPATWGVIFTIRTGPADFSHRLVTSKAVGGLMPGHMRIKDGLLWRRGEGDDWEQVPTPEERDLFKALGMTYIDPAAR